MRKLLPTAALLALLVPAVAQAAEPVRVTKAGYTMEYSLTDQSDGSKLISGRDLKSDEPFSLTVKGRHVEGVIGEQPVSFTLSKKLADNLYSAH